MAAGMIFSMHRLYCPMTRVLVTGGTGALGSALVPQLVDDGYTVRVMSRSSSPPDDWIEPETEWVQADLATGTGLATAIAGVDVVVHAASNVRRAAAVDVEGTRNLVEHARTEDVSNFVYVSIVGIDAIPFSYYQHKLAAEVALMESDLPWTIQRATQFHTLLDTVFDGLRRLPVWPLPTEFQVQPIAPEDVATRLREITGDEPAGRVPDIGGPEVHRLGDLARIWADVRDLRRPVIRIPAPGRIARGFRDGHNTTPEHRYGTISWDQWVEQRYTPR